VSYYVYILSSRTKRLYIGVTNDLERRIAEHKTATTKSFAKRYNINRLAHIEESDSVRSAIEREKQLKAWRREKNVALIEAGNPE
jgi:putative endonuclease